MDFLFELLFQVFFELFVNVLFEFGFRAVAGVLRARISRLLLSAVAGFGFGVWWGERLSDAGLAGRPKLFYVAVAATVAAVAKLRAGDAVDEDGRHSFRDALTPWRWDAMRLAALALLNVAIACGIDVGYSPLG